MRNIFSCLLIFLLLVIYLSLPVIAEDKNAIFTIEDPAADDCGPCYYNYPTDEVFHPYEGLFDIRKMTIIDNNDKYLFKLYFTEVTDPWESKYGFSMPLIELYIDNEKGGCKELFKDGANIKLDPNHPWNRLIKVSGWWVRVFTPRDKNDDMINLTTNAEKFSRNIENCLVEVNENIIIMELEKKLIGDLADSYIYILVGSFDPFGYDHFRGIKKTKSLWNFSAEQNINLEYAPRVIDIILPFSRKQQEVLGSFEDEYCQIYPVKVIDKTENIILIRKSIFYIIMVAIFSAIIIINKDEIFKYNG